METTIVIFRMDREGVVFALFPELDCRHLRDLLHLLSACWAALRRKITTAALPTAGQLHPRNTLSWRRNFLTADTNWKSASGQPMPCTKGGEKWRALPEIAPTDVLRMQPKNHNNQRYEHGIDNSLRPDKQDTSDNGPRPWLSGCGSLPSTCLSSRSMTRFSISAPTYASGHSTIYGPNETLFSTVLDGCKHVDIPWHRKQRASVTVQPLEIFSFWTVPGPGSEWASFGLARYPAEIEVAYCPKDDDRFIRTVTKRRFNPMGVRLEQVGTVARRKRPRPLGHGPKTRSFKRSGRSRPVSATVGTIQASARRSMQAVPNVAAFRTSFAAI